MAKREPIRLGAREFASKKAAMEHVKSCLNWYHPEPGEEIDLPPEGVAVMKDVFLRHPDFDRKFPHGINGIERIYIKRCEGYGKTWNEFWCQYEGVQMDVSYTKCFGKKDSYKRNCAISAFREAIADQVVEFKRKTLGSADEGVCAMTGMAFPSDELEVDHYFPFRKLVDAYLRDKGVKIEDVNIVHVSGSDGYGTRLAENELADWSEWHRKHAQLQLINKTLNMKLGTKDKESDEVKAIVECFVKEQRKISMP